MRKVGGWNPKIRTNDLCIGPRCKGLYFLFFFVIFCCFVLDVSNVSFIF